MKARISHELPAARTPQQNGIAEKKKTLKKKERTMIADAKLPKRCLTEAINTTCYMQNKCMVNKQHNKAPYEL